METDNLKQVDFQIAGIAIGMEKKKTPLGKSNHFCNKIIKLSLSLSQLFLKDKFYLLFIIRIGVLSLLEKRNLNFLIRNPSLKIVLGTSLFFVKGFNTRNKLLLFLLCWFLLFLFLFFTPKSSWALMFLLVLLHVNNIYTINVHSKITKLFPSLFVTF